MGTETAHHEVDRDVYAAITSIRFYAYRCFTARAASCGILVFRML